jgi:hypothetical protein
MEPEFYIIPSLTESNVYFLFRDIGIEVKFTLKDGRVMIIGKGFLTPNELEFIKIHFLFKN